MKITLTARQPAQNFSVSLGLGDGRDRSEPTVHPIIIAPVLGSNRSHRATRSGPLYAAAYLGEVIVTRSTQPALDAARVLQARGLTGVLEMWDDVSAHYRFRIGIIDAAKLTIEEGDRRPRFVKFKSFKSFDGRDTVDALSARPGINMAPKPNGPFTTLRPAVSVQG